MAPSTFETAAALQHLIQGTTPVLSFGHSNCLANLSVLYPSRKTEVVTVKDDGDIVSACVVGCPIDWKRTMGSQSFEVLDLVRSENSYIGTEDSLEKLLHKTQESLKEHLGKEITKYRQSSSYEPK